MAVKTRAELLSENSTDFPDNTSGLITPAKLRGQMNDLADSPVFPEDIANLDVSLARVTASSTTQTLTAWVEELQSTVDVSDLAPIQSPAFIGNPTAPTPAPEDNSTSIATTAFVAAAVDANDNASTLNGQDSFYYLARANHTGTQAIATIVGLDAALDDKADLVHTHVESDITGLVADLAAKASLAHTHAESDITNLVADLAGKAALSHTHAMSDITGLTAALADLNAAIVAIQTDIEAIYAIITPLAPSGTPMGLLLTITQ